MDAGSGVPGKHRTTDDAAADYPLARTTSPGPARVFTEFALMLASQRHGRALTVLQAGCTTSGPELDLAALRAAGHDVEVSLIDDASPQTQAIVAIRPELGPATLAELGRVPLRPRSFDIVECSLLLHRIANAEMVLARLVAALRPSGLLLLRIADPASAAGFLDRRLPGAIRTLAWRSTRPGQPGPHPAVYERVGSARGIEAFISKHGLAVAHRSAVRSAALSGGPASLLRAATRLTALVSYGHLAGDHDELCYVVVKPEDRFARVLR